MQAGDKLILNESCINEWLCTHFRFNKVPWLHKQKWEYPLFAWHKELVKSVIVNACMLLECQENNHAFLAKYHIWTQESQTFDVCLESHT